MKKKRKQKTDFFGDPVDWVGNSQSVMATLNASNHSKGQRADQDYYATPAKAVTALLELEDFKNTVWECACGEGHITRVLDEAGLVTFSSDLVQRDFRDPNTGVLHDQIDFLNPKLKIWHGDIITNPPFAKATEFVYQAMKILPQGHKLALLLRVQFLEGVERNKLFKKYPPKRIWVSSRNLRCAKNGDFENATGNASTYCWFVWVKGFQGKPTLGWFLV